ncbi:MAG: hypothetical protein IPO41_18045 [Acidobacteria bacterium]|nr:hypothetical protein [Acidobacteriota bacterium]
MKTVKVSHFRLFPANYAQERPREPPLRQIFRRFEQFAVREEIDVCKLALADQNLR